MMMHVKPKKLVSNSFVKVCFSLFCLFALNFTWYNYGLSRNRNKIIEISTLNSRFPTIPIENNRNYEENTSSTAQLSGIEHPPALPSKPASQPPSTPKKDPTTSEKISANLKVNAHKNGPGSSDISSCPSNRVKIECQSNDWLDIGSSNGAGLKFAMALGAKHPL
eukprot:Awhi_evm2s5700